MLATLATNRTKTLLAGHDGVTSALIGGYHLAFLAGMGSILVGAALAVILLRPRPTRSELRLAEQHPHETQIPAGVEIERQAA